MTCLRVRALRRRCPRSTSWSGLQRPRRTALRYYLFTLGCHVQTNRALVHPLFRATQDAEDGTMHTWVQALEWLASHWQREEPNQGASQRINAPPTP